MSRVPKTAVSVQVNYDLRDACEAVCDKEGVRLTEALRFCMIYMRDTGRLPVNVPEEYRGQPNRHGTSAKAQAKTFFG